MAGFDANEHLTPFRDARGYGAILFDRTQLRQPDPAWFDPAHWGDAAQPVGDGGRGGAWFIDMGEGGDAVLRHYLRGGLVANVSRDAHLWRGIPRVRSFAEYRLLRVLRARKLPVPMAYAAWYRREGLSYRAAILMQRLPGVRSLAELASAGEASMAAAGALVARFHRQGVGRALMEALVEAARAADFRQLFAVIGDSGNAASIGLHAALGFERAGLLRAAGFKFGRWLDVVYMQRSLG